MNNKKISLPRTPAEWLEAVMNFIFFLCGILAVGCVLLISVYMVLSGVPAIRKIGLFRFLFGTLVFLISQLGSRRCYGITDVGIRRLT